MFALYFMDLVPFLDEKGLKILIAALKGKRTNFTCKEATEVRFITKFRWVEEAVLGILRKNITC